MEIITVSTTILQEYIYIFTSVTHSLIFRWYECCFVVVVVLDEHAFPPDKAGEFDTEKKSMTIS